MTQGDFNFGASSQADFILNHFLFNFLKFPLKFSIASQPIWQVGTIKAALFCLKKITLVLAYLDWLFFARYGLVLIRDLIWFSDLENLLSIGRIFYQLGESYLNLFCYIKWRICDQFGICDQFLHRYQHWRIFLSNQNRNHQFMTFSQTCPNNAFILRFYTTYKNYATVFKIKLLWKLRG